jgi:hypothetical protein
MSMLNIISVMLYGANRVPSVITMSKWYTGLFLVIKHMHSLWNCQLHPDTFAFIGYPWQRFYTPYTVITTSYPPILDDDEGQFRHHTQAKDSSTYQNHLQLLTPPRLQPAAITLPASANKASSSEAVPQPAQGGGNASTAVLKTGALSLRNNFAINKRAKGMPMKWEDGRKECSWQCSAWLTGRGNCTFTFSSLVS